MRIGNVDGFQTPKYTPGRDSESGRFREKERNDGELAGLGERQRLNIPPELAKNEGEGSLKRGHPRRRGEASGAWDEMARER